MYQQIYRQACIWGKQLCSGIKHLLAWLFGVKPETGVQGFGTLLIGSAALFALVQGSSLIDRVLQIQTQSKQIGEAVTELKAQSKQISLAIDDLRYQLKASKANQTIQSSLELKSPTATVGEIENALKNIPTNPSPMHPSIYLPVDQVKRTAEKIYSTKDVMERAVILQDALEYNSRPIEKK